MKRREESKKDEPPPDYGPEELLCTLCIHYGGKFNSDLTEWVGGEVYKFDYVEKSKIDIIWLVWFANISIGCTTFTLIHSRYRTEDKFFLIRRQSQLYGIVEDHLLHSNEVDIYLIDGEGVDVPEESDEEEVGNFGEDKEGAGVEGDIQVNTDAGTGVDTEGGRDLDTDAGGGVEGGGDLDSDAERRRKGKGVINDVLGGYSSGDNSSDSDFLFNSYDSGSDDKLFHSNVDLDAEWLDESDPIIKGKEDCNEEEGNEAGQNILGEEDLCASEDDFTTARDDDHDGSKVPVHSEIRKYNPVFLLGMIFRTKKEFKEAVDSHAITEKRTVLFTKSDSTRVYAKCGDPDCSFKIHLRRKVDDSSFEITTLFPDHTCVPTSHVKNMNSNWLSGRYEYQFKTDKKRNVEEFRQDVVTEVRCDVTWWQAYSSKKLAMKTKEGNAEEQYALLWSYANEIRRTNHDSTVKLGVEQVGNENKFARFYVCLGALKKGYLAACRPIFGIDGTFLKGPYGGILLCAVGIDPNNNLYPIAWAVVGKEDGDNWEWFLRTFKADLGTSYRDDHWTIVSDNQKGLVKAVQEVFPSAAHRFCVSHMNSNFLNAGFRGQVLKTTLWRCAKAATVGEFARKMEALKKINPGAFEWLKDKHPSQWSRSHFTTHPRCDVLVNNMCESFNAKIFPRREMPILSMLETIMKDMMKRQVECRELGAKWKGPYCPRIQEVIDLNSSKVPDCQPIKSSPDHYQISCFDGTQYAVDLAKGTCGCRKWDLTGIPCKHALCAISSEKLSLDGYVHSCYNVQTYMEAYNPCIMPINGRTEWEPSDAIPPLPPKIVRQAGRPPKARRREVRDPAQKTKRRGRGRPAGARDAHHKKRNQVTLNCSSCGGRGHNKRSCHRRADENEERVDHGEENVQEVRQDMMQEEIPTQSQVTQATQLQDDDLLLNDDHLMEIDELVAQQTMCKEKGKGKAQVVDQGSSINSPTKTNFRVPPPFIGDERLSQFEPPKQKIGPIVKVRGTKFLMLSHNREL